MPHPGRRLQVNEWLAQCLGHDTHPLVQFIKYGLVGAVATLVDMIGFRFFALFFSPDRKSGLSDAVRSRNFVIDNALAFLISNFVCYLMNVAWVFEAGRYNRWVEIGLFYAVSGTSVLVGTVLGKALIRRFHWDGNYAYLAKLFAALMLNFVLRKFVIFKG
jgi:putative flippase GtrA